MNTEAKLKIVAALQALPLDDRLRMAEMMIQHGHTEAGIFARQQALIMNASERTYLQRRQTPISAVEPATRPAAIPEIAKSFGIFVGAFLGSLVGGITAEIVKAFREKPAAKPATKDDLNEFWTRYSNRVVPDYPAARTAPQNIAVNVNVAGGNIQN